MLDSQPRMAAGEDQTQLVVMHGCTVISRICRRPRQSGGRDLRVKLAATCRAANRIHGSVPGRCDNPAGGVGRYALTWPAIDRCRESVLDRILGERKVIEDPSQRRHCWAVGIAEGALNLVHPRRLCVWTR